MMKPRFRYLIFLLLGLFFVSGGFCANYPKSAGWVSDFAGIIDEKSKTGMEEIIREVEQKTSCEISIVTVKNFEGEPVEKYASELFKQWGVGKKGKDNGVLILVSVDDRKARIEVGYGLEGVLPDGLTGGIMDSYMLPEFKKGNYGQGLYYGTFATAKIIAKEFNVELSGRPLPGSGRPPSNVFGAQLVFSLLVMAGFILNLIFSFKKRGGRRYYGGSGFYGGGFGGGFSSGGFGGFGGGFSGGGGASRGW